MAEPKQRQPPLAWLKCPACNRKYYRWLTRKQLYKCLICGCLFKTVKKVHEVYIVQDTILKPPKEGA